MNKNEFQKNYKFNTWYITCNNLQGVNFHPIAFNMTDVITKYNLAGVLIEAVTYKFFTDVHIDHIYSEVFECTREWSLELEKLAKKMKAKHL